MRRLKVIVERHPDGFIAYPIGMNGAIVGEGDTDEEAIADATSAIRFAIETFGHEVLGKGTQRTDAYEFDVSTK